MPGALLCAPRMPRALLCAPRGSIPCSQSSVLCLRTLFCARSALLCLLGTSVLTSRALLCVPSALFCCRALGSVHLDPFCATRVRFQLKSAREGCSKKLLVKTVSASLHSGSPDSALFHYVPVYARAHTSIYTLYVLGLCPHIYIYIYI